MGNVYLPKLKSGAVSSIYWLSYYAEGKRTASRAAPRASARPRIS